MPPKKTSEPTIVDKEKTKERKTKQKDKKQDDTTDKPIKKIKVIKEITKETTKKIQETSESVPEESKKKKTKKEEEPEIVPYKLKLNPDGKILVIVESPGKIKKIQSILGSDYIVTASVGHIIDLSSKTMSIDIGNDFKPRYVALDGKGSVIRDLKKLASSSSDILLATDEDREGEMIAWSLSHVLGIKDNKRITFNSITKDEIIKAVKNPREIDNNLVDAQKSRRMLDRIVGYEISPLLWKSIGQSLSAGRVQSVVVRIILDREQEIQDFLKGNIDFNFKFKADFYKNIIANLYQIKKPKTNLDIEDNIINDDDSDSEQEQTKNKTDEIVSGTLIKGYKSYIGTEKLARELMDKMIESEFKISGKGEKTQMKNPSPPFTTSTLQQEASRKLGFTIKRTMMAAQHLYEAGHITYMRTDSINLSSEAIKTIGDYIKNKYGNDYHSPKNYKTKSNNTQEAHECIRPTHSEITGLTESAKISNDEIKLYVLIWKRAIASQMKPAKLSVAMTQISISKLKEYYFQTDTTSILFDGFLKVYNIQNIENENEQDEDTLTSRVFKINEILKLNKLDVNQDYQKPLPRYNEASLVNKLDPKNLNIGRPSTYAAIITKIQERGYVEKKDNDGITQKSLSLTWNSKNKNIEENTNDINIGKDTGKLVPTAIGKIVTEYLVDNFPDLMDYKFTSNMEKKLDNIAEGTLKMTKLMDEFYNTDFHPIIDKLLKDKVKYVDKNKRIVGKDKDDSTIIATVRRYGPVIILEKDGKAINTGPLKLPNTIESITLDEALKILSYPKLLGKINNKEVKLYKGKFGLYAKYGDSSINLGAYNDNEEDITIKVIEDKLKEKSSKNLWEGKDGKINYVVLEGPYGKYISIKDTSKKTLKPVNVKLSSDIEIKDLTLEKIKEIADAGKINKYKFKRSRPIKK